MKYETVIFDLDGILLKNGILTKEALGCLEILLKNNVQTIYSSGKNYWYTAGGISFANLMAKDTVIIAENGGIVFFPFSREKIMLGTGNSEINAISAEFKEKYCVVENDNIFLKEPKTPLWQEPKETIFTLFPLDTSCIPLMKKYLEKLISHHDYYLYVIDHSDAVDTVPIGQHKGNALEYLANESIIDLDRCVAFGDGNNDKEMLETVALPVTVDNAEDSIKNIVKDRGGIITHGAYGKGVLEALHNIFPEF